MRSLYWHCFVSTLGENHSHIETTSYILLAHHESWAKLGIELTGIDPRNDKNWVWALFIFWIDIEEGCAFYCIAHYVYWTVSKKFKLKFKKRFRRETLTHKQTLTHLLVNVQIFLVIGLGMKERQKVKNKGKLQKENCGTRFEFRQMYMNFVVP